ncbi:bifunctional diaminohydroxyphosphoribosylaminopyrimidine deaminase/5-amino-6-(5-phosphoribosylamino)uracil reductase RibD [Oryzobacter terrae]|uniref:bifunctional diaminohydroxyphosphoribosylaminopyrimidine deaminase/5-amino-6-(5-phosphoribosylamino)uracil reductase RibD n=1 Tax=Oryzobacter terrae TaxID=1620385 RepID=UPI00366E2BCB
MDEHTALMQRALDAARLGPEADPNPRVGCVVIDRDGRVVGTGHHRGAGTAHAEVDALARTGGLARGGTALVTLEPCDHTGRTGPCTRALLDAGVARVRYALADPDVAAAGGAAHLAAAGVDVALEDDPALRAAAEDLNATWLHARRTGRPWVTWKTATTLDGRTAAADGSSRWITGEAARADVHALRARVGAVLVGTGTALADDPALTVRDADGAPAARQPLRVVAGTRALPDDARLLDGGAETLVVASHDPAEVLAALTARGVHHVLLEGGATLAAAFLRAGLVDEVVAYLAPTLLGAGPGAVGDLGITTIGDAVRLETTDVTVLGGDVRITARPVRT